MSHDHGSPEIQRKARSIARLIMVVVFIALSRRQRFSLHHREQT